MYFNQILLEYELKKLFFYQKSTAASIHVALRTILLLITFSSHVILIIG